MRRILILTMLSITAIAHTAFAGSSFQNSCSNIKFAYINNQAALKAVCLNSAGTASPTSLILQGISNQNGILTQGSGASTFQQSCGNITIGVDGPDVTLYALCASSTGEVLETSLPLNNISNSNGTLTQ